MDLAGREAIQPLGQRLTLNIVHPLFSHCLSDMNVFIQGVGPSAVLSIKPKQAGNVTGTQLKCKRSKHRIFIHVLTD